MKSHTKNLTPSGEELLQRLTEFGQQHLLAFWDQLSAQQRDALAAELSQIDFALIERLYRDEGASEDWADLARRAEPPEAFRLAGNNRFSPEQARTRGEHALRQGEVGVIIVAGGQGTRLGFDAPKGVFPIGPVSGASLFQILLEKIRAARDRYQAAIPLYVMTSPATHADTTAYLAKHERFGLPEKDVQLFCQGTMPAIDAATGRLLLAERDRLFLSPDGHGGMLGAFRRSGALADCEQRGVRHLFYLQVDNPLVAVCDPEFLGYHLLSGSEMTTQVVAKEDPLERVGNFVVVDGRARVIEYSDLPDDAARQREADGSLKLWAGSIGVHVLDVAFLERIAHSDSGLPFHRAKKKVPYIDDSGQLIEPSEPNAIKFERFIFDLLPEARNPIAVEVDQAQAFAPVKNAPGEKKDTPEHVQAQMIRLHTEWLRAAGATVEQGVAVEISPLFALDAAGVREKVRPGTQVSEPTYFR